MGRVAQLVKQLSYELDVLGSNIGGYEIFRSSRLALVSNKPPVQWVPGLSWGVEAAGIWG